ncbi:MAG TPA: pilus assembly protein N-terminal domain-containing protein [bacterium]|nr:pilus assembly protein N-terminal domain-containing protein [bacterium]
MCAAALAGAAPGPIASAALPALTVYATQPTVRTSLHLQPGFALIVRADRRIDTVAIGDPRMVAAAPVHRGPDVFDVVLQPLSETGTTNMVLWFGDVTTIWNLDIGPGPRTADVVFVVTQPHTAQPAVPRNATAAAAVGPRNGASAPGPSSPSSGTPRPPDTPAPPGTRATAPPGEPALDLRQTVGAVTAVFHAFRTRSGILLRYEITNGAEVDLLIKPAAILVRADGRPVAYGMARDSVDRGRPDVIPRGATETGVIDIATPSARQIALVLSLAPAPSTSAPQAPDAPAARAGAAPTAPLPIVLQATFSGLDRLSVTPAP